MNNKGQFTLSLMSLGAFDKKFKVNKWIILIVMSIVWVVFHSFTVSGLELTVTQFMQIYGLMFVEIFILLVVTDWLMRFKK